MPVRSVHGFAPSGKSDRDEPARAALYRTRLLVNRTPHFSKRTRKEANRGLDLLESQLGRNQVSVSEAVRGMELLNRAHSSLTFGLLREPGFVERFGAALRQLGLRGIEQRLDEVPARSWPSRFRGRPTVAGTATTCRPSSGSMPRAGRSRRRPATTRAADRSSAESSAACGRGGAESQPIANARRQRRFQVG